MFSKETDGHSKTSASPTPAQTSLLKKTITTVSFFLFVIVGFAIWLQLYASTQDRSRELEARAQLISQIQATALATPVWNIEKATVETALKGLQADQDFASASITDQTGTEQYSLGQKIPDSITASSPIVYDNQVIGTLNLSYSSTRLKADTLKLAIFHSTVGLVLLGAIILALYGTLQKILQPLLKLRSAMLTLAEGNTDVQIPALDRKDEVGAMAAAVSVFKENKIKNLMMQAEKEAEQESRLKRAKCIQDLSSNFETNVMDVIRVVASSSTEMQATAKNMSQIALETSVRAGAVALTITNAAHMARTASNESKRAAKTVENLSESASSINKVVDLISKIASQTNLLAHDATMEATRAGEAGRGFAVVANEVRNLANQTAKAAEEIGSQISAIQTETNRAVTAIRSILDITNQVKEISSSIAALTDEQNATNNPQQNFSAFYQNQGYASSKNISSVTEAAIQTGAAAEQVLQTAEELAHNAEVLRNELETFLVNMRSA